MKLSLPGFLKRDKATAGKADAKPMPQLSDKMKPASLARVRLLLLITGVSLLFVLAYFGAREGYGLAVLVAVLAGMSLLLGLGLHIAHRTLVGQNPCRGSGNPAGNRTGR